MEEEPETKRPRTHEDIELQVKGNSFNSFIN